MECNISIVSSFWHTTVCDLLERGLLGKIKAPDIEKALQAVVQLIQSAAWFPYRR